MNTVIAVDSGGTFTDAVLLDADGRVTTSKSPSTPQDFSAGVMASVAGAAASLGIGLGQALGAARPFCVGTTVATNALLTRSGARVGLITTKGHEDALIIGRTIQKAAGLTDRELTDLARLEKARPIVPRPLTRGVTERVDYKGSVVVGLDLDEARAAASDLLGMGAEAIAVCFLWSFLNPDHERRVEDMIAAEHPGVPVTCSHRIAPVIKEYERTATTALNAYLARSTRDYLSALQRRLRDGGLGGDPVVMQSTGGVAPAETCKDRAVALLGSGPAGGVIGAARLGQMMGIDHIVTTDVGGTSFDVGLVVGGEPLVNGAPVFDQYHTVLPAIDVVSIGAGGGSVAWIEPGTGLLKVGPASAGADPGPVCYGAGGAEPTVTDANLVLGRIDPDYFLGGAKALDKPRAEAAIGERIAGPLGITVAEAAAGIVDIIDARMADLVRNQTIGRGYDPGDFALFAFGGAGPLHAGAYAIDVGVRAIVVPAHSSVFSAFGIAGSDLVNVRQASDPMMAPFDPGRVSEIYARLEEQARADLAAAGVAAHNVSAAREIEMRYRGQVHELRVPVPAGRLGPADLDGVTAEFRRRYDRRFGRGAGFDEAGIEARTLLVRGAGRVVKPEMHPEPDQGPDPARARTGERPVFFRGLGGFSPTAVFRRERLRSGNRVDGPAVIEAADTTVVVHPSQSVRVDQWGSLLFEPLESPESPESPESGGHG